MDGYSKSSHDASISLYGSEVSIPCAGEGDQTAVTRDIDGILRVARHQDLIRCDLLGPLTYVSLGSAKTFPFLRHENTQREKHREGEKRVSRIREEVLGDAYLGMRLFREYGRHRQYRDEELCERAS